MQYWGSNEDSELKAKKLNNTPSTSYYRGINKFGWLILVSFILVIAIVAIAFFSFKNYADQNYAKEIVAPIEKWLVEKGATKLCESGDGGRGIDNKSPWYRAEFVVNKDKAQTVELVNQVAQNNNYKLVHASPDNRGHLGAVADIYISNWYFDNSSKPVPYRDLKQGNVNLAFGINAYSTNTVCNTTIDSNHSVVGMDVQLPEFK